MADPTPIQNLNPVGEPQLLDLLQLWRKDLLLAFNCHAIANVSEFFPGDQTATVTIAYKQSYLAKNPDGTYSIKLSDYPALVKAPVHIYGGGGGFLTFPIAAGDECLVCFNDRDLSDWLQGKKAGPPATTRLHSFSDAIIIVGLKSALQKIEGYDMERGLLEYKNARVGVGKDNKLVLIGNDDFTLFELLNQLVTQVKDLVTAVNDLVTATAAITVTGVTPGGGASGPPANAANILAVATDLAAITTDLTGTATDLGELIE